MDTKAIAKKDYDLFVSYSHADRLLVQRLAWMLNIRKVRVWFDGWEMKPGDYLRERIQEGIDKASFMLVVISPQSLSSNWVRYELNSGMIGEIEAAQVRVIPAVAPGADFVMLPTDLRAKFCLDLRSEASIHSSLESIVDLVQPERRLRSELLQRLRKPGKADVATVAELREYANGPNHDQQLQIAALRGLAPIPGPEATLAVAERALNSWGIGAIHAANRILARRREYGGLLVLSAVLELDDRFLLEKKDLIVRQLRKSEDASAKHLAERFVEIDISSKKPSKREERLHSLLENCEIDDLRHGAVISRLIDSTSSRELHLPKPENIKIAAARTYSDTRIPGFLDLLSSTVNRLSSFLSPDSDRNRPQDHPFTIVLADTTSSMIYKGGQPGRGR